MAGPHSPGITSTGACQARPVPPLASLATEMEVSCGWLCGITYTPPLGSNRHYVHGELRWLYHSIVFPSADSLVTHEAKVSTRYGCRR